MRASYRSIRQVDYRLSDTDSRVGAGDFAGDLAGSVLAPVVHDQDLEGGVGLLPHRVQQSARYASSSFAGKIAVTSGGDAASNLGDSRSSTSCLPQMIESTISRTGQTKVMMA